MKAFEYVSPASAELAVRALAGSKSAAALSGGTDLINRMKDYVTSPERVVYLKGARDLAGVTGDPGAGGLTIGAGTRLADLLAHKGIREHYPALWQAAHEVGTPQIRNMATVGGNLLQRPRCWYFRNGHGLLALRDGKSMVREGDNRYHAVFQTDGDALFVNPSSLAAPLIALGARATVLGGDRKRAVAVQDLYRVPKAAGEHELTVGPDELLVNVVLPEAKGKNASYEVRWKQAHDWPLVLASVNLELDGGKVAKARVVLAGVAPVPWRSEAAERAITGKAVDGETASAAGAAATEGAKPLSMNGYKVALVKTCVRRALLTAAGHPDWEEA